MEDKDVYLFNINRCLKQKNTQTYFTHNLTHVTFLQDKTVQ